MDLSAPDFTTARQLMVDGQLRPTKVNDPRVLEAMRRLPRERFLPPAAASLAYIDEDVPLPGGRALMEPLVLARLIQLAAPRAGERALVIGAGTGYGAAVLAATGASVVALEEDKTLLALARGALAALAPSVVLAEGPLAAGWPSGAPWDLIFIEGAVPAVPAAIAEQLRAEAGRLVTVLAPSGLAPSGLAPSGLAAPGSASAGHGIGRAVLAERTPAGLAMRPAFDCATPMLPAFRPAPSFVF